MGRLFDAGQRSRDAEDSRRSRNEVRKRAEEAERAIQEELELEEGSKALGAQLGSVQAVQAIRYKAYRARGSKWNIEHAEVGPDYVFQLFPLRPPRMHWKDVILAFIDAMEAIFPRSIEIRYTPPSERYQLKYYTIRVEGTVGLPGWETARDRALAALSTTDAWTVPEAQEEP